MRYNYIRGKAVRNLAKENGKGCGHLFLAALDRQIYAIVIRACKANGNNRRLSAGVIE